MSLVIYISNCQYDVGIDVVFPRSCKYPVVGLMAQDRDSADLESISRVRDKIFSHWCYFLF